MDSYIPIRSRTIHQASQQQVNINNLKTEFAPVNQQPKGVMKLRNEWLARKTDKTNVRLSQSLDANGISLSGIMIEGKLPSL